MSVEKLVIIGSGPAGLTAALYASRAALSPLVIEGKEPGGQLMGTSYVENWPGEISIQGPALMQKMHEQVKKYGTRFLSESLTHVDLTKRPFSLTTHKNAVIETSALIIATGAQPRRLNCPGESTYWGRGISSCAVCDGAFYKDKKVIIVGGGDSAMETACFMKNFTNDITIIHILPALTASYTMQQRVLNDPSIQVLYESTVIAFEGAHNHLTHALVQNQKTGEQVKLAADGAFIAIGLTPATALFKEQLELNNYGYIILKNHTETSVPGVFAAGDVADSRYRQAITSAGSGCAAALDAERFLKSI